VGFFVIPLIIAEKRKNKIVKDWFFLLD
jgi:hypothetical protein